MSLLILCLACALVEPPATGESTEGTSLRDQFAPAETSPGQETAQEQIPPPDKEALRAYVKQVCQEIPREIKELPPLESIDLAMDVYQLLLQDKKLSMTERLQLQSRVRQRLGKVAHYLEQRLKRLAREARRQQARPDSLELPEGAADELAQQGANPGAGGGAGGAAGPGGNGRQADDYGPDLVRLIQQMISPEIWDVNGGEGSVQYYRPLRVLVIRAPQKTHSDAGELLDGARQP